MVLVVSLVPIPVRECQPSCSTPQSIKLKNVIQENRRTLSVPSQHTLFLLASIFNSFLATTEPKPRPSLPNETRPNRNMHFPMGQNLLLFNHLIPQPHRLPLQLRPLAPRLPTLLRPRHRHLPSP